MFEHGEKARHVPPSPSSPAPGSSMAKRGGVKRVVFVSFWMCCGWEWRSNKEFVNLFISIHQSSIYVYVMRVISFQVTIFSNFQEFVLGFLASLQQRPSAGAPRRVWTHRIPMRVRLVPSVDEMVPWMICENEAKNWLKGVQKLRQWWI